MFFFCIIRVFCGYQLGPVINYVGFKCMNSKFVPVIDKRDKAFY